MMSLSITALLLSSAHFVATVLLGLAGFFLILRCWMFGIGMSPAHPFYQVVRRTTDWLVKPLGMIIPTVGRLHLPSLVSVFIVAFVSMFVEVWFGVMTINSLMLWITPIALVCRWFLSLVYWGLIIWCVLSWVRPGANMTYTLQFLLDPFLRPVRRFIPPIAGFDLSPIIVFIVIQVLYNFVIPLSSGVEIIF